MSNLFADDIARTAVQEHGAVQKIWELARLIELVNRLPRPLRILEIGSYTGGTLYAWRQLTDQVVGVDSGVGLLPGAETKTHGATLLRMDSEDPLTVGHIGEAIGLDDVDFLFIDGDHHYEPVKRDFWRYGALVRPGGLIALHDICHHQDPEMGVERFWGEVKNRALAFPHRWELIGEPTWWGGIGALTNG